MIFNDGCSESLWKFKLFPSRNRILGILTPLNQSRPFRHQRNTAFWCYPFKKPSEQVKKFLRIVDFVNLEYKNFLLW